MCNVEMGHGWEAVNRDEDCPECDWPETYTLVDLEATPVSPKKIGCSRCGWSEAVGYGE